MRVNRLVLLLAILSCFMSANAQVATARRTAGIMFGVQSWTFSHYTVMESIERVAQPGGTNIELYPGQDLGKDFPGVKVGPDLGAAATDALRAQLSKFGVNGVAYRVP